MQNDILLHDVSKSFGNHTVLRNVNMQFPHASCTALRGPSGVGKTTLLRLIAGLDKPDSGQITGGGICQCSMVFQETRLFPWLSAADNIRCVLPDRHDPNRVAQTLLEAVELPDDGHKYPAELSGGMQQRVAIARALAADRPVLLLDEPFRGIDRDLKFRIISRLQTMCHAKTLILVTHDPEEITALANQTRDL